MYREGAKKRVTSDFTLIKSSYRYDIGSIYHVTVQLHWYSHYSHEFGVAFSKYLREWCETEFGEEGKLWKVSMAHEGRRYSFFDLNNTRKFQKQFLNNLLLFRLEYTG